MPANKSPKYMDIEQSIQKLKHSAGERDWNKSHEIVAALFSRLTQDQILTITLEYVYQPLETFEQYHPSVDWPRALLEAVRDQKVTKELIDMHWERILDYSKPGSGNFLGAIDSLFMALEKENDRTVFIEKCVDAIANALMSILDGYWGTQNINDWNRYREAQEHIDPETGEYEDQDPSLTLIPIRCWSDNEVIKRDMDGWIQLAEDIERELNKC